MLKINMINTKRNVQLVTIVFVLIGLFYLFNYNFLNDLKELILLYLIIDFDLI